MPRRIHVGRLRERLGLSQQAMADTLGVGIRSVQRWEAASHDPSPMATATLKRLMDAKGVTDAEEPTKPTRVRFDPPDTDRSSPAPRHILPSLAREG